MFRGEGMCSPKVTPGTAAAFGGITDKLRSFGIPVACCADGPQEYVWIVELKRFHYLMELH